MRVRRLVFDANRRDFTAARGLLRVLLDRYLEVLPGRLVFGSDQFGKPRLAQAHSGHQLKFNLSHSDGVALYAATGGGPVGIDVGRIRRGIDVDAIAQRFFYAEEQAALEALAVDDRLPGFFTCWRRKEASSRAHGAGLSTPLDRFTVSLVTTEPAALLKVEDDPAEVRRR